MMWLEQAGLTLYARGWVSGADFFLVHVLRFEYVGQAFARCGYRHEAVEVLERSSPRAAKGATVYVERARKLIAEL
jgi:hypothetical protein